MKLKGSTFALLTTESPQPIAKNHNAAESEPIGQDGTHLGNNSINHTTKQKEDQPTGLREACLFRNET